MADRRWPIRCPRRFNAADIALLRAGLWPQDMDDRWAVWLDGSTLRCWRSWTGTCVYEASLQISEGDGAAECGMLDVLDDEESYVRAQSEDGERERFEGVLSLLLGRRA